MNNEQLIWDYLDGNLSPKDQKSFEDRLESDQSFRTIFNEHALIHKLLKDNIISDPSPDFTEQVLRKLEKGRPPVFSLNGIVLFLIGFILVNLVILFVSDPSLENTYEIFTSMNTLAQNSTLQLIGLILVGVSGLVVLDQILSKRFTH